MTDIPQRAIPSRTDFISVESLLAAIVDSSDDAIISKDLDGVVTSWNRGAERIFGYTAEEMIGQPIIRLIPPERRHEELTILNLLKNGNRVDHFDTVRVRKDGSFVDVSLTISPIKNSAGVIVGASKIARDISARKRWEHDLELATTEARNARTEVERQSRLKDEFLTTVSHELRTPLQSILGWTQLLLAGDCEDSELTQGLEVIDRNVRSQTRIIEDLLDMNRILSGKVRLDVQRVGLAPLIEAALETVKPAAQAKGIDLRAILDANAQPISGDPNRLQQIFWNLLSNAIKFTPQGGSVEVHLERVNSHMEVTVTDTGMGIAPDFLPYVFERFRQADGSTTRRHGGLGLGLAIVKHLAELHGGSVRAKSGGPSSGASFTVMLPIAAIQGDLGERRHRHTATFVDQATATSKLPRLDHISAVVVDDEADARTLIATILAKAGADVRSAGSVEAGLELVKTCKPDVLISDIGMPGQDGYALIRAVRALPPDQGADTPAIALTAYARTDDRIMAIAAGFQMHVAKPADALELLTMVESLARSARRGKA